MTVSVRGASTAPVRTAQVVALSAISRTFFGIDAGASSLQSASLNEAVAEPAAVAGRTASGHTASRHTSKTSLVDGKRNPYSNPGRANCHLVCSDNLAPTEADMRAQLGIGTLLLLNLSLLLQLQLYQNRFYKMKKLIVLQKQ